MVIFWLSSSWQNIPASVRASVASKGENFPKVGPSVGHGLGGSVDTPIMQWSMLVDTLDGTSGTGGFQVAQALYTSAAGVVQDQDVSVLRGPVQVLRRGSASSTHVSTTYRLFEGFTDKPVIVVILRLVEEELLETVEEWKLVTIELDRDDVVELDVDEIVELVLEEVVEPTLDEVVELGLEELVELVLDELVKPIFEEVVELTIEDIVELGLDEVVESVIVANVAFGTVIEKVVLSK
ncbi:hypothetical protein PV08_02106 [Exophiala spinifera]|uniref:Uncharacterized protein n=1 Tax=Exophiala spinifera TaxID=91928 RepID=A0A0D1Z1L9_9EURO|nr:uncharacterized protein PV08_02106 [Exophiala spinifera]KIW21526.1 hypothetical protein PV08_02106 [Exophiala spinifera]